MPSAEFYNVAGVPVDKIAHRLPSVVTIIGASPIGQKFKLSLGVHSMRQNFVDDPLVGLGLRFKTVFFVIKSGKALPKTFSSTWGFKKLSWGFMRTSCLT